MFAGSDGSQDWFKGPLRRFDEKHACPFSNYVLARYIFNFVDEAIYISVEVDSLYEMNFCVYAYLCIIIFDQIIS